MMARGEFAYLLAEKSHASNLLSDEGYAIVIWALIYATLISPVLFSRVLKIYCESTFTTNINLDLVDLESNIQLAFNDAKAALKSYISSNKSVIARQLSFDNAKER